MSRYHLVLVRRRGERFVLRCFDCDWGTTVRDRRDAWRAEEAHVAETTAIVVAEKPLKDR